jgi:Fe2+ transport system protein B
VIDLARARGLRIDQAKLSTLLGQTPVVETVGNKAQGLDHLLGTIDHLAQIEHLPLRTCQQVYTRAKDRAACRRSCH